MKQVCNLCKGIGTLYCETCRGNGFGIEDGDCLDCDGFGKDKCLECGGTGEVEEEDDQA